MSDYGLKVMKSGFNINNTDIKNMVFTSAKGVLGIRNFTTISLTTDSNGEINHTITHNFGYAPIIIIQVTSWAGDLVTVPAYFVSEGTIFPDTVLMDEDFTFEITSTTLKIISLSTYLNYSDFNYYNLANHTYTFKIYYFFNEIV